MGKSHAVEVWKITTLFVVERGQHSKLGFLQSNSKNSKFLEIFLPSSWLFDGFSFSFFEPISLMFSGELGFGWQIAEIKKQTNRMCDSYIHRNMKSYRNLTNTYTFTEVFFFASFCTLQYCIRYWFYSERTTLWPRKCEIPDVFCEKDVIKNFVNLKRPLRPS